MGVDYGHGSHLVRWKFQHTLAWIKVLMLMGEELESASCECTMGAHSNGVDRYGDWTGNLPNILVLGASGLENVPNLLDR